MTTHNPSERILRLPLTGIGPRAVLVLVLAAAARVVIAGVCCRCSLLRLAGRGLEDALGPQDCLLGHALQAVV